MADDKNSSSGGDPFVDVVWTLLAIYLLMQAIASVGNFFDQKGISLSNNGSRNGIFLSNTKPVSEIPNPIGRKVVVSKGTIDLYNTPGGEKVKSLHFGEMGTIVSGPQVVNGEKYWKVKFDNGDEGWVKEGDLGVLDEKYTPMNSEKTLIGTEVLSNEDIDVYAKPGEDKINSVPKGTKGTILEGPLIKNGKKYWHIKFENGVEGWVDEKGLDSLDGKQTALSKKTSLIGETVVSNKDGVKVLDGPNGNVIAVKNKGEEGKIIEGPLVRNGVKYWHVRFSDGTDGWVSENDLDHKEVSELNIFGKAYKLLWQIIGFMKYLILLLCLVFIYFIYYLYKNIVDLGKKEKEALYPKKEDIFEIKPKNETWEKILVLSQSQNENDWRQAIIESDIMLSNLLDSLGLVGDGVGEKLKNVNPADFKTINNAWEAHKVRNNIAHAGGEYLLNQREVNRVIELYRTVFEEFKII